MTDTSGEIGFLKRWRPWIGLSTILLCFLVLWAARSAGRGPFEFLERFHPRRVKVDAGAMLGHGTPAGPRTVPRIQLLEFDQRDSPAVLAALKGELTASKGYRAVDQLAAERAILAKARSRPGVKTPDLADEQMWVFTKAKSGAAAPSNTDGAFFVSGTAASSMIEVANSGVTPRSLSFYTPRRKACIVVIAHDPDWFESQMDRIRAFLHLG